MNIISSESIAPNEWNDMNNIYNNISRSTSSQNVKVNVDSCVVTYNNEYKK